MSMTVEETRKVLLPSPRKVYYLRYHMLNAGDEDHLAECQLTVESTEVKTIGDLMDLEEKAVEANPLLSPQDGWIRWLSPGLSAAVQVLLPSPIVDYPEGRA